MNNACVVDCIIIRHRKENLRKCSLSGLEDDPRFMWVTYPSGTSAWSPCDGCFLLGMDGPVLSDHEHGVCVLLDATWRYAHTMRQQIPGLDALPVRSIPAQWRTAYPRRQTLCEDPERGLASVEALFVALRCMHRSTNGILDRYRWREQFLSLNSVLCGADV